MKNSSTLLTFSLVLGCLFASTDVQALTKAQIAVFGSLVGAGYLLYARDIDKSATPRYSAAELKDVKNVFSQKYLKNIWYLFYDGLIGQRGKGSTKPFGLLGTVDYYLAPLKKASGFIAFGYLLYNNGRDLEKHLAELIKIKEERPGQAKAANIAVEK